MTSTLETRLTPGRRLTRGLANTAMGPVDIGRGIVGLGVASARAATANAQVRLQRAQLHRQIEVAQQLVSEELSAAQEVVAGLPEAIAQAGKSRRVRRIGLIAGITLVSVAGAAIAVTVIRRSQQPEPSPLPPSVEVDPRP